MSKRNGLIVLGAIIGATVLTVAWSFLSRVSIDNHWGLFDSGQTYIGVTASLIIGTIFGGLIGAIFAESKEKGTAITILAIGIVLTLIMCPINFITLAIAGSYYGSDALRMILPEGLVILFPLALGITAIFLGILKYRKV